MSPLRIETFTGPGFGENAYLVGAAAGDEVIAIDPGADAAAMAARIDAAGWKLRGVVLTHAHIDHIEGIARLVARHPAEVWLHPGDRGMYDGAPQQAAMFGMRIDAPPPVSHALRHAETLEMAGCAFEVRHVPGHSPGHVILYHAEAQVAFVGDVVFQGSIGRTDLPGGDYRTLMESIRSQVLTLPDATVLYTGHGPATTVGHERATNPFLIPHYGGALA